MAEPKLLTKNVQIPIPSKALRRMGKEMVRWIIIEAKKDAVWSNFIPSDPTFYHAFKYKVTSAGLVVYCTWPWMDLVQEGMPRRKMTWLTRPMGVRTVPFLQKDGTVLFRSTPITTADAWIHPGIARHTFIDRAFKKALRRVPTIISQELGRVNL